jgi:hypothetical protein
METPAVSTRLRAAARLMAWMAIERFRQLTRFGIVSLQARHGEARCSARSVSTWRMAALLSAAWLGATGCNEDGSFVTCGDGTELVGGECRPTAAPVTCGDGTALVGNECLPSNECPPSKVFDFELGENLGVYGPLVPGLEAMGAAGADRHLDQGAILGWIERGPSREQLSFLYDHGKALTERQFTAADGVGTLRLDFELPGDASRRFRFAGAWPRT